MLTLFIAALLIFTGLAIEWLVRRSTENLRRQIFYPGRQSYFVARGPCVALTSPAKRRCKIPFSLDNYHRRDGDRNRRYKLSFFRGRN
jgi:hypothetical protein